MLLSTEKPDMFTCDRLVRTLTVCYDNEQRVLTPSARLPKDYWQNFCAGVRRGRKGVFLSIALIDPAANRPPLARAYTVPHIEAAYDVDERLVEIRLEPFGAPRLGSTRHPKTLHTNATLILVLHSPDPNHAGAYRERQLSVVKGVRLTLTTGEMYVTL